MFWHQEFARSLQPYMLLPSDVWHCVLADTDIAHQLATCTCIGIDTCVDKDNILGLF